MNSSIVLTSTQLRLAPVLALLLLLWVNPGLAQQYRIQHCYLGCPVGADSSNQLLLRSIYALSYNTDYKTAQWVAYEVHPGAIGIASSLSREPLPDDRVSETLAAEDFQVAGESAYLRAQYVPLVSFAATPYWREVNYMTNAVARTQSLSQGAWYGLDWAIRNLVNREGPVYVVTGPVFYPDTEPRYLETSKSHRVPDAFFKLVVTGRNSAAAFLFPQDTPVHVHHCDLTTSLSEIEQITGLDLAPENRGDLQMDLQLLLGCR